VLEDQNSKAAELEKTLERGKREWEATFDAVQHGMIVTNDEGIVIRCNKAATQKLQTTFEQLINSAAGQITIGERDQQPLKLVDALGEVYNKENSALAGYHPISIRHEWSYTWSHLYSARYY